MKKQLTAEQIKKVHALVAQIAGTFASPRSSYPGYTRAEVELAFAVKNGAGAEEQQKIVDELF